MDAYYRYNQIKMYPPDEDKTSFITDRGIYYYKVMLFDLMNIGANFQRMVNKVFRKQIEHTMLVYINDMLMKSLQCVDYMQYLSEALDCLLKYKVRLNPKKCTFKVASEKFFTYLITQWGIEANPN